MDSLKIKFFIKFSKFIRVLVNLMSAILINESGKRNISSQNFTFNWGIIWNAISPLIIVIGFAILMSIGLRAGYSLEYFVFILLFWFGFQSTAGKIINVGIPKFLLNSPGASVSVILIANFLNNMLQLFLRFLLCYTTLVFFNFNIAFLTMIIGYLSISAFTFSYSIILSSLFHKSILLKEAHSYFLTALFFTSSILIPVPLLPNSLRYIFLYNPLVHFFEWLKIPTTNIEYSFIDINYFYKFLAALLICTPIFFFYKQRNLYINLS